ncbi:30S ribosomal protein S12 methylthiotransferase RimO [bacterium]|nr:30S ribosomal protein S12 methylthiotransferase RimO [bacterium]
MEKIYLLSLGCPKNLVDSENIMALLGEKEYILTDSPDIADIIIINTCAFLKSAVKESKAAIKYFTDNNQYKHKKIVVCGCLVQRYGEELFKLNGVDGISGISNPEETVKVVEQVKSNSRITSYNVIPNISPNCSPRLVSTYPYAYIKISEGCDNLCSYCLIPKLRGRLTSRSESDILNEAESLLEMGIKELIIIAQDTSSYGWDTGNRNGLENLLSKLAKLKFPRIRIMYSHPAHITKNVLDIIQKEKNICKYIDIPLQHIHPEILQKMNRPVLDYGKLIDNIRETVPEIRLRTTFIVGFPGETDEHFEKLVEFVKEKKFDRLGVFKYSREKETEAFKLKEQIKKRVKLERERILMEIQKDISKRNLEKFIGKTLKVLVEGKEDDFYVGRSEFDAPEIDGNVYIETKTKKIVNGDIKKVKIIGSTEHDLFGILPNL